MSSSWYELRDWGRVQVVPGQYTLLSSALLTLLKASSSYPWFYSDLVELHPTLQSEQTREVRLDEMPTDTNNMKFVSIVLLSPVGLGAPISYVTRCGSHP
jgi:hypothetical protein